MPSAIVATVGAATANSFQTEAEMIAWADDQLNAEAWNDEADNDKQLRAMLRATRELDLLPWKGTRVDSTQALSWPRDEVVDPDLPWASQEPADTYYFSTTEIPQRVKNAHAELTLEFLRAGTKDIASGDTDLNVRRKKIDVLETEYFSPHERAQGLARYPRVMAEIAPLLDEAEVGVMGVMRM